MVIKTMDHRCVYSKEKKHKKGNLSVRVVKSIE